MRRLLNEIYRPSTVDSYIFKDQKLKKKVKQWIDERSFPSLLLSGPPGTGKTSLARLLIASVDIDPSDVLVINTSLNSGIDAVRNDIEPWLSRMSFGPFKVVLMEEFERMSPDAQKALKAVIEGASDHVRFIATSNNIASIEPANISRLQHYVLDALNEDDVLMRVVDIIESEGLKILNDDDDAILSHVHTYYPDMRKIIDSIDKETIDGVIHPCNGDDFAAGMDVWETVWSSGKAAERLNELLEATSAVDQNNYNWFYQVVYNNLSANVADQTDAIIMLSNYLDKATRSANQRLHLDAFLYNLFLVEES